MVKDTIPAVEAFNRDLRNEGEGSGIVKTADHSRKAFQVEEQHVR